MANMLPVSGSPHSAAGRLGFLSVNRVMPGLTPLLVSLDPPEPPDPRPRADLDGPPDQFVKIRQTQG